MSMSERMESLKLKHKVLERELHAEAQRPLPDPIALRKLKREKLRIKDEMMRLRPH